MKHIKTYEARKRVYFYKVGDYVLMRNNIGEYSNQFLEFISTNVGKIVEIDLEKRKVKVQFEKSFDEYLINGSEFDYYPNKQKISMMKKSKIPTLHNFALSNVAEYSSNRDDIEALIMAKKYNL